MSREVQPLGIGRARYNENRCKGAITESAYQVLKLKGRKERSGWFDTDCEKQIKRLIKYIYKGTWEKGKKHMRQGEEKQVSCVDGGKEDTRMIWYLKWNIILKRMK